VLLGAALFGVAAPAVAFVYVRGAFTAADAAPVVEALRVFACAVPGWIAQTLAVRPFYARGEMWRPMLLATAVSLAALPLYAALGPRLGASGLALAGTLSISLSALVTLVFARHWHGAPGLVALLGTFLRTLAAAAPAAWAAQLAAERVAARVGAGTAASVLALAASGLAFAAVGLPLAWRIGDASTREALAAVARRLRRRPRR
jgi:putative peptidoglycan lipid II flippase